MPNRFVVILVAGLLVIGGAAALFYSSATKPAATPEPSPRATAAVRPVSPTPSPEPAKTPTTTVSEPKPAVSKPTPEPSPTTGTLIIESDVPGTSVFVDREFKGTAPVTATGLTPGPHRINMSVTGYEGFVDTIDIEPGTRTFAYSFKEIKLDAKIAVTHKHSMGSCSGTLRATPQGLVYDTTTKSDAFSVALTDLDTFTIDYLEKNLKVKTKAGKTYNFADADGDVNRLFLFHRDVDKARQRLIGGR